MKKENEYIGYGFGSLFLGIITIILILSDILGEFMELILYFVIYLPLAFFIGLLGLMAYWGGHKDKYIGLIGIILAVLIIPIGLIFSL